MNKLPKLRWYFFTRGIGAFTAAYELLVDHSSERGTIILAAFGIMGFDWVSRREQGNAHENKETEDKPKS